MTGWMVAGVLYALGVSLMKTMMYGLVDLKRLTDQEVKKAWFFAYFWPALIVVYFMVELRRKFAS